MYGDPAFIRDIVIKVRLNDPEAELIDAVVKYTGQQKSTLIRELFMAAARKVLAGEMDIAPDGRVREEPQMALGLSR